MYQRYGQPVWQQPLFVLIGVNILVYILTIGVPSLVVQLGIMPAVFLSEPWTAVTSMFVHGSPSHVIFNMLALYFLGSFTIQLVGERTMLAIYFIGGVVGSLFFWLLGPANAVAVGASGAIFALGGTLAVLRPMTRVIVFPIPIPMPLWIAIIGGGALISLVPGVAWEAHLGGLLTGIGAALIITRGKLRF
ncbi:rhomboid family intramembrane serine protease [Dehalogenimonas sp. THU2]|uniref:rhomboid family intramembrane serine protease n=1 Tax=Dehalogenimonas sp. THU2 TaxID=3151121 RepID=UPI003218CE47